MAFELIPFPLSILFVLVFGVAYFAVLWKLRKTGKIYSFLFRISVVVAVILIVAFLYDVIVKML
jgi:hypothetical protein